MARSKTPTQGWVVERNQKVGRSDYLATEEPLEIRPVNPCHTVSDCPMLRLYEG